MATGGVTLLILVSFYLLPSLSIDTITSDDGITYPGIPGAWIYRNLNGQGTTGHVDTISAGSVNSRLAYHPKNSYADGLGKIDNTLPNPRLVSTTLFKFDTSLSRFSRTKATDLHTSFGQFLMKDIIGLDRDTQNERVDIAVPACDEELDPFCKNNTNILYKRISTSPIDLWDPADPDPQGRRVYHNTQTSWLDLSQLYGPTGTINAALREGVGGRLRSKTVTAEVDGVVKNFTFLPNADNKNLVSDKGADTPSKSFYLAGEKYLNQDPHLIAWHTLWLREHNRLAGTIADEMMQLYPDFDWTDDDLLFYETRRRLIAVYQNIIFREYLPVLIGRPLLTSNNFTCRGLECPSPQVSLSFITCASLGHQALNSVLYRMHGPTIPSTSGHQLLRDMYYQPSPFTPGQDLEAYFLGMLSSLAKEYERFVVDDVRDYLYRPNWAGRAAPTSDLIAMDIQRGRDLGVPFYNDFRESLGLVRISDYNEITRDPSLAAALRNLYPNIDRFETFVGLMVEDHEPGNNIGGVLISCLDNQFTQLREQDAFYWEREFSRFNSTFGDNNILDFSLNKEIDTFIPATIARRISNVIIDNIPALANLTQTQGFLHRSRSVFQSATKTVTQPDAGFEGVLVLDDTYKVNWKFESDRTVRFRILANAEGWVGISFDPGSDGMTDAYIVVGGVFPNGTAYLGDYYAPRQALPKPTAIRYSALVNASQDNGKTMIEFIRPIFPYIWGEYDGVAYNKSKDLLDKRLRYVGYAFHPDLDDFIYHGPTRGLRNEVNWQTKRYVVDAFLPFNSSTKLNVPAPKIQQFTTAMDVSINTNFNQIIDNGENLTMTLLKNDTQGSPALAASLVINTTSQFPNCLSFLGGITPADSRTASYVLLNYKTILMSPFLREDSVSVASSVSSGADVSFFIRPIPTYSSETQAMIAFILKYKWKTVALLYSNDEYGSYGLSEFSRLAKLYNVTVGTTQLIESPTDLPNFQLDKVRAIKARIIVNLLSTAYYKPVLISADDSQMLVSGYVWITSHYFQEALVANSSELLTRFAPKLNGLISFQMYAGDENQVRRKLNIRNNSITIYPETAFIVDSITHLSLVVKNMILLGKDPKIGSDLYQSLLLTVGQPDWTFADNDTTFLTGRFLLNKNNGERLDVKYYVLNFWSGAFAAAQFFDADPIFQQTNSTGAIIELIPLVFSTNLTTAPIDIPPEPPKEIYWVKWGDAVAVVVVVITTLLIVCVIIIGVIFAVKRNERVIKSSSPVFLFTAVIGMIVSLCFNYVWTAEPTVFICNFRPWFAALGFSLFYGSLFVKVFRSFFLKSFTAASEIDKVSNTRLLVGMLVMWFIYVIVLIVWSAYDPFVVNDDGESSSSNQVIRHCHSDSSLPFIIVLFVYTAILLGAGCYFSWETRNLVGEYNETKWLALSVIQFTFSVVCVIPATFGPDKLPLIQYLILGFGIIWLVSITCLTYFSPKLYQLFKKEDGHWKEGGGGSTL